jgi:hypothetical protein
MSISAIYQELHRNAARTGDDRSHTFSGGARIAVRVIAGRVTLTIARKIKRVGDVELETFKRDCGVPPGAVRWPADGGQATRVEGGVTCYVLGFQWDEPQS